MLYYIYTIMILLLGSVSCDPVFDFCFCWNKVLPILSVPVCPSWHAEDSSPTGDLVPMSFFGGWKHHLGPSLVHLPLFARNQQQLGR